jgi:hypothetical protein
MQSVARSVVSTFTDRDLLYSRQRQSAEQRATWRLCFTRYVSDSSVASATETDATEQSSGSFFSATAERVKNAFVSPLVRVPFLQALRHTDLSPDLANRFLCTIPDTASPSQVLTLFPPGMCHNIHACSSHSDTLHSTGCTTTSALFVGQSSVPLFRRSKKSS